MLQIAKRTTVGLIVLLAMPVTVWMSGWHWQPGGTDYILKALFAMTETVTSPWGALTSIILAGWFLWCLRFRIKATIILFIILTITVVVGQQINSTIKNWVQEPRPYVMWLEGEHNVDVKAFYSLKRGARGDLVTEQLQNETRIPQWLKGHWAFETGFAFPSGHTMFVATWALLAFGLLLPRRRYISTLVISIWAISVMGSRLVLGMHWPQDLIVATLISWVLVTISCALVQRFCGSLDISAPESQEIKQRTEDE